MKVERLVPIPVSQEAVLDVIPIKKAHTAVNLSLDIAARVDARKGSNQVLYAGVTDNAKNVVNVRKVVYRAVCVFL